MQSALAAEIQGVGEHAAGACPKHLRVGLNSCLSDASAIATLLIRKGLITGEEYEAAVADAMEAEAQRCAERTRKVLGLPDSVSFG